jgi:hypothetical protein
LINKKHGLFLVAVKLMITVPLIACTNTGSVTTVPQDTPQPVTLPNPDFLEIWITDKGFIPDTISISVGDRIKWTNRDSTWHAIQHSAVGDTLGEQPYGESGRMQTGDSFTRTFTVPGIWYFVCPKTAFSGVVYINSDAQNK